MAITLVPREAHDPELPAANGKFRAMKMARN
jgi:hypothetical protein